MQLVPLVGRPDSPKVRVVITSIVVVVLATWIGAASQHADHPFLMAAVALATLATFALLRAAPVVVLMASLGAPLLASWSGGKEGSDDPYLALIVIASYGVGRFARYRHQPYIAAGVLALTSLNVAAPGRFVVPQQLIFPMLITVAPWILGLVVRRAGEGEAEARDFAAGLAQTHRADLEEATLRERLRVARELHDITAHTMNVVSLQAQVLRRRHERGENIDIRDLHSLEASARQAMTELRQVLGALRAGGDHEPLVAERSVEQLPDLVEECRNTGQDIRFEITGEPGSLAAGASLTAFRVAQESLTNARRHGAAGVVELSIAWHPDHLLLITRSELSSLQAPMAAAPGVGLIGMRERVGICGGRIDAGPLEPGRWVVRASLPVADAI